MKLNDMEAYIITKPLQYINCTNIAGHGGIKKCYICDMFANSKQFYDICCLDKQFDDYKYIKNKRRAIYKCLLGQKDLTAIYIDSDYGLYHRILFHFFFRTNIYVFEEGYACYLPLRSPTTFRNKLLLLLSNFFKVKNFNGGSPKVKGIYLYDPESFNKAFPCHGKILLSFKMPFFDAVKKSSVLDSLCKDIDFDMFREKSVLIYLSSWTLSEEAIKICQDEIHCEIKVLKLHPQIKEVNERLSSLFDITLPSNLMFEFFFSQVKDKVKELLIVHHGTFAVNYIQKQTNIRQIVVKS